MMPRPQRMYTKSTPARYVPATRPKHIYPLTAAGRIDYSNPRVREAIEEEVADLARRIDEERQRVEALGMPWDTYRSLKGAFK